MKKLCVEKKTLFYIELKQTTVKQKSNGSFQPQSTCLRGAWYKDCPDQLQSTQKTP